MSVEEFLTTLRSLDVTLRVDGDQLRVSAPKSVLTPALREQLAERKAELLAYLRPVNGAAAPAAPPLRPAPRSGPLPLSFSQEGLWFLEQLTPGSAAYNVPIALPLSGPIDVTTLERSLNEVLRRHEALRTTFQLVDGEPAQIVGAPAWFTLPLVDLRQLPKGERDQEAERLIAEEAGRPFDLARGPLFRARLLQLQDDRYRLLVNLHHIVSDGWSLGVLARELEALYQAYAAGEESPLPALPVQYGDYARWQRAYLQGDVLEQQLSYWRRALGGDLAPPELPTDRPRPAEPTLRGAVKRFEIEPALWERLTALSRREGVTLYMTLLAAFDVLLHRYSGQTDIVVGTPVAGRNREEVEGLIGLFVNTLVLRTDLSGDPTFRALLQRVREVALEGFAHQDVPFELVVRELHPQRDIHQSPLFQVMFAYEKVGLNPLTVGTGATHFDLTVFCWEHADRLTGLFEYSTDLFEAATIERMIGHLLTLLAGAAANPDARLSELPLLTAPERHQLLVTWNATETAYPRERCVHELFAARASATPDAIAVVSEGESLTYRELDERSNQLAHYLQELGVGPDVLVGICVERSPELVVGLLGILKAGGAYLPLDPAYPKERLAFMLDDARVPVVLTQQALVDCLPAYSGPVVCLDVAPIVGAGDTSPLPTTSSPDNLVYVMYTSGSTGTPKGVAVPHRAVVRLVVGADYVTLDQHEVLLQLAPISFDAATFEIWGSLLNGARLVLAPPGKLSLEAVGRTVQRYGVTTLWLTAGLFHEMVERQLAALRGVRQLLAGGDVLALADVRRVASELDGCQLINGYGPTETTTFACCWPVTPDGLTGASVPIGRPIANTRVYVLDRQRQPVPIGVPGELYIGGDGVARGYLNRPELTTERFVPDPFGADPGARLYKTGDLVRYRPDGTLEFLGRLDDQVKIRGFRIELGEVEAALRRHPRVGDAVVVARGDTAGDRRLVAYVVPDGAAHLPPSTLQSFLRQKLPDYMVPSLFVTMDRLPLNPNGKVDRRALPAPGAERPALEQTYVPPRSPCERRLVAIWERLLGVRPIGVTDDFFALGGHSLLAARLFAEIASEFGTHLPLASIFPDATIEHLADLLGSGSAPLPAAFIVPIQPRGEAPPLFLVHGIGGGVLDFTNLARAIGPEQPVYGVDRPETCEPAATPMTIEAMAQQLVRALRAFQPAGPYRLGGHCFGGLLAYEMAQQLVADGQEVALLALIETEAPSYRRVHVTGRVLREFARNLPVWLADVVGHSQPLFLNRLRRKSRLLTRSLNGQTRRAQALRAPLQLEDLVDRVGEISDERRQLMMIQLQAARNYRLRPYPGQITVFRARCRPLWCSFDHALGWGELAAGAIVTHVLPGNHVQMMTEQRYIAALATRLRRALAETAPPRIPLRPPAHPSLAPIDHERLSVRPAGRAS